MMALDWGWISLGNQQLYYLPLDTATRNSEHQLQSLRVHARWLARFAISFLLLIDSLVHSFTQQIFIMDQALTRIQ